MVEIDPTHRVEVSPSPGEYFAFSWWGMGLTGLEGIVVTDTYEPDKEDVYSVEAEGSVEVMSWHSNTYLIPCMKACESSSLFRLFRCG